jgi:crossover junction endodeoxyribonuclease RuvC
VIRVPAGQSLAERLAILDSAMRELVQDHRPSEVAVETVFHSRSARSAIVLGHARGVILLAAAAGGATVAEYAPLEIKMSVTGSGGASKQQVRHMVHRLIDVPSRLSLDAADALGVALCHVHRRRRLALAGAGGSHPPARSASRAGRGTGR